MTFFSFHIYLFAFHTSRWHGHGDLGFALSLMDDHWLVTFILGMVQAWFLFAFQFWVRLFLSGSLILFFYSSAFESCHFRFGPSHVSFAGHTAERVVVVSMVGWVGGWVTHTSMSGVGLCTFSPSSCFISMMIERIYCLFFYRSPVCLVSIIRVALREML